MSVVGIMLPYEFEKNGEKLSGVSKRLVIDGQSYKVNDETYDGAFKDFEFIEHRFFDNKTKQTKLSYEKV